MKIILASGIYPPELGGPATYAKNFAAELTSLGHTVVVVTFGEQATINSPFVVRFVSRTGGPLLRWWRYSRVLRTVGKDADIVYAFTSVSCGIPLLLAHLKKPAKVLRLGGDFVWERYTDWGGRQSLVDFYAHPPKQWRIVQWFYNWLLQTFDHIIFSTKWQQQVYGTAFSALPSNSVLQNALAVSPHFTAHSLSAKPALLTYSRLVRFKNIDTLLRTLEWLPRCTLTIAGSGPDEQRLRQLVTEYSLTDRVRFIGAVPREDAPALFATHDTLIVPSLSDISPNAALEAYASGLPVVITTETGLSTQFTGHMCQGITSDPVHIQSLIERLFKKYPQYAPQAAAQVSPRTWAQVAADHIELFRSELGRT